MSKELQVINFEETAMEVSNIKKQVQTIQKVMAGVMKDGEHYGTVPGCGTKKVLLKPGAEKICTTFRLSPTYEIQGKELPGGHREYEIVCTLTHIPTGQVIAQGVGLCTSMESKYRWRKQERLCPKCGKPAIIKGKEEYGGGWLCWSKKEGCNTKFKDGDPAIESQKEGRVENPDIADTFNTVLKIGKKRSHVDAVLTATAASDIFTQDLEDTMPIEKPSENQQEQPQNNPPQEVDQAERDRRAIAFIDKVVASSEQPINWDTVKKTIKMQSWHKPKDLEYIEKLQNAPTDKYEDDLPF